MNHNPMLHAVTHNPAVIIVMCLLVRCCVGLFPHSGQGDPPMYGDFEAQRHWMEVTLELDVGEWYFNSSKNDLEYWGLDYPPLTAYVSHAFALAANIFLPELVAFDTSKGFETTAGRSFMRTTVLVCDLVVLIPAVWLVCLQYYAYCGNFVEDAKGFKLYRRPAEQLRRASMTRRRSSDSSRRPNDADVLKRLHGNDAFWFASEIVLLVLLQPSFILIDHGHFQYNNVSIGLTVFSIFFILRGQHILGSVAFALALNFKQMLLYFSPVFFCYLLSHCIRRAAAKGSSCTRAAKALYYVMRLGVAVILTFAVLWAPFCVAATPGRTCGESLLQVLVRLFPFNRGLFEDKVANVWCAISPVVKLKELLPEGVLVPSTTVSTLVSFLPSCVDLLTRRPGPRRLLWALFNVSLSFFLFSYQVHEKSILIPVLPAALLIGEVPGPATWFSVLAAFSMTPLLIRDGLAVPYVCTVVIFCLASALCFNFELFVAPLPWNTNSMRLVSIKGYVLVSLFGMVVIHLGMLLVPPPERFPDIWPLAISIYSCAHLLVALLYGNWSQYMLPEEEPTSSQHLKLE